MNNYFKLCERPPLHIFFIFFGQKISNGKILWHTQFNPVFRESLSDISERLIKREIETKIVDENE